MNQYRTIQSFSNPQADRAAGILLGLAAGDRNGGPAYMATTVSESLCKVQHYDMIDVAERHFAWWREGSYDTGPTFAKVMALINQGVQLDSAVAQVHREGQRKTAGCNPAHRAPPLAMARFLPTPRLAHFAGLEAAISHWDPIAAEVAATIVVMCRLLLEGESWEDAKREAGYGHTFKLTMALEPTDLRRCKVGGYSLDVLQATVSIMAEHKTFSSALDAAFDFAGPANYAPVLVGALGGARWGASTISSTYLEHIKPDVASRLVISTETLAQDWDG